MDTKRLKQFCVIVETASMTKAAHLLHLTHSGLSKSMKTLQDHLGYALLQPSGRGIAITERGLSLYQRSKEFLALEERLFASETHEHNASLRIGTVEIFLLSMAEQFKHTSFQDSPITLLDLDPGKMEQLIIERKLDMAITYVPFPMENIDLLEIGKYYLGCYHLEGCFKKQSFSDIPFVVPAHGLSNNPLGIRERDGWLESLYPRNKKYYVNLLSTALELTLQGLCAIYIPHFVAHRVNAARKSQTKLVEYPLPTTIKKNFQNVFILTHKGQPKNLMFKQICKMTKQIISQK